MVMDLMRDDEGAGGVLNEEIDNDGGDGFEWSTTQPSEGKTYESSVVNVYPGPSTIELPNVYGPQAERYGFNYNLKSVFAVSFSLGDETNVEVLIVRDRIGTENYWFPAKTIVSACGFLSVYAALKHRCPPDAVQSYRLLQQRYGFTYSINHNMLYMNEEALNGLFFGRRRGNNSYKIDSIRSLVNQFYRTRKYVIGETVKQLADEYVRRSLPMSVTKL